MEIEIETDCETVEVASVPRAPSKQRTCLECGAAFVPLYGTQNCCSDECKRARKKRLIAERYRRVHADFDRSPRVCPECGTSFVPTRKNQVCCCTACSKVHARNDSLAALKAERTVKARRRAVFFAARDRAFERAGLPIPKIEVRNGVRIENRGVVAGRPSGKSSLQISPKSYYYR